MCYLKDPQCVISCKYVLYVWQSKTGGAVDVWEINNPVVGGLYTTEQIFNLYDSGSQLLRWYYISLSFFAEVKWRVLPLQGCSQQVFKALLKHFYVCSKEIRPAADADRHRAGHKDNEEVSAHWKYRSKQAACRQAAVCTQLTQFFTFKPF